MSCYPALPASLSSSIRRVLRIPSPWKETRHRLPDQGCRSATGDRCWAAEQGSTHLLAPSRQERAGHTRPRVVDAFGGAFRTRIAATNDPRQDRFHRATHRATACWGLRTGVARNSAVATFAKRWPLDLIPR